MNGFYFMADYYRFTWTSITTVSSYIADVNIAENRGNNVGMIDSAFGLGFFI